MTVFEGSSPSKYVSLGICALILLPYVLLADVMREGTFYALSLVGSVIVGFFVWSYYVIERRPTYAPVFTLSTFVVGLSVATAIVLGVGWIPFTPFALVHLLALALILAYWLVGVVAVYHEFVEYDRFDPGPPYESLTAVVPAYNEEGYVGRTIESLLNADYPPEKRRIVVVDDGSTDGTYREASQYESEAVRVLRKENGGKYSALNYGLLFAEDDLVVTVDADSVLAPDALKRLVAPFRADPDVGAVASNVKIVNRDGLVTKCQSLEYLFGINIYRRLFDHFGIVPIVPGCLGAFRREVLEEVHAYDPHTLTEDFDTTLKVLLTGHAVRTSAATVYTEAPNTWTDLYNQRLRWYRGNYMTLFKHWRRLLGPETGYLHRLFLPVRIAEMFFLPFAGWIVLGVIAYLILSGSGAQILLLFLFFTSIVVLINALAVQIEGEDLRHVFYSPLFVVGYKHFHDLVMIKSLLDVVRNKELHWTRAKRANQQSRSTDAASETPRGSTETSRG